MLFKLKKKHKYIVNRLFKFALYGIVSLCQNRECPALLISSMFLLTKLLFDRGRERRRKGGRRERGRKKEKRKAKQSKKKKRTDFSVTRAKHVEGKSSNTFYSSRIPWLVAKLNISAG